MIKYLGTHNSGTSSKLVWWQRPLGFIFHATSRCQTLSIEEQLKRNVRLFNLQIAYHKKQWVFSHGICIYTEKFYDAINMMVKYATKESPIYFQLRLDKNFLLGQHRIEFIKLVDDLIDELKGTNVYMRYAYIEDTQEYVYQNLNSSISISEHYWSMGWATNNARNWIDKLPLPKRHAKEFNQKYIDENTTDYLMLDFIEFGNYPKPVKATTKKPSNRPTVTPSVTATPTIEQPIVTVYPTPGPTSLNRLSLTLGKKTFEFKPGYNFTIKMKRGASKTIIFDTINNYPVPNNLTTTSNDNMIATSSLEIGYRSLIINAVNTGKTKIYLNATYRDEYISGYITVNVEETSAATPVPTVTPTVTYWSSTTTSTPTVNPTTGFDVIMPFTT